MFYWGTIEIPIQALKYLKKMGTPIALAFIEYLSSLFSQQQSSLFHMHPRCRNTISRSLLNIMYKQGTRLV